MTLVMIGTVIQLRMTWSREQLRDIASEAGDAIAAARDGAALVVPDKNSLAPLLEALTQENESISQ